VKAFPFASQQRGSGGNSGGGLRNSSRSGFVTLVSERAFSEFCCVGVPDERLGGCSYSSDLDPHYYCRPEAPELGDAIKTVGALATAIWLAVCVATLVVLIQKHRGVSPFEFRHTVKRAYTQKIEPPKSISRGCELSAPQNLGEQRCGNVYEDLRPKN
jgi:hypothetical protein